MTSIHTIVGPDGRKPAAALFDKPLEDIIFRGSTPAAATVTSPVAATHGGIHNTHGWVQANTAATVDSVATIVTTQAYTIGNWSPLMAQFDGVRLDASGINADFSCIFRGAANVFGLFQGATDATAVLLRYGSGTVPTNFDIRSGAGRGGKLHKITIGVDLARKQGLWRVGDGALEVVDLPALTDFNNVVPRLAVQTKEAVSHSVRCSRLQVWGDYSA